MIKKSIIFVMLIVIICLGACEEKPETYEHEHYTREFNELIYSNDYYSIWTNGSYSSGEPCKFQITPHFSQESLEFNGIFPENPDLTFITEIDVTGDNIKDILIQLTTVYDDELFYNTKRDLYIFDGKRQTEINATNIEEYIKSITSFSSDKNNYYVTLDNDRFIVEKSAFSFISPEYLAEDLYFGGLQDWGIDRQNRLYYTIDCTITTPDASEPKAACSILAYLTYGNRELKVDHVEFYPSHYNERIIQFQTNSIDWNLWYNTNYLVLENSDGRRFHFGDRIEDYGAEYNIPLENRIQFYPLYSNDAKAFINGNYAAIVHKGITFTANDPNNEQIIIVNLLTGLIEDKVYADTDAILNHNKVDRSVLSDYFYTDITPIGYYEKVDVTYNRDEFTFTFSLQSFDGKLHYEYPIAYKTKEAQ